MELIYQTLEEYSSVQTSAQNDKTSTNITVANILNISSQAAMKQKATHTYNVF